MTRTRTLWTAFGTILLAAALGWFALGLGRKAQADPALTQSFAAAKDAWKNFQYQEAAQCTQCHSVPNPQNEGSWDLCSFLEWPIWKTHDKHAQAYVVLLGDRGKKIGELLFPKLEKKDAHAKILDKDTGCLGCHAMSTLPGAKVDPQDGVSCGGCHGPSSAWVGP